jgi:hypothetical protein
VLALSGLEQAVSVAKTAVSGGQTAYVAGTRINNVYALNQVRDFNAIGPDILNGCSTHATGYKREIFEPKVAFCIRPKYCLMPILARLEANDNVIL